MGIFNDVNNIKNAMSGILNKQTQEFVKRDRITRKCFSCGEKMKQGRATIDERGNRNFGMIYCPEDVGMLENGADVVMHQSTWYDPVFYCEKCQHGLGEFSLKLEFGNLPKCLREERKVSGQHCPYCDKPMEQGNFFIAFLERYIINWFNEDLFENSYTAPVRKRSYTLRRSKEFPNAHVCKKCKKVFATLPLQQDLSKKKSLF